MKTLAEHAREFLNAGSGLAMAAARATGDALGDVWPAGLRWMPIGDAPDDIRVIATASVVFLSRPSNDAEAVIFSRDESGQVKSYLVVPAPPKN